MINGNVPLLRPLRPFQLIAGLMPGWYQNLVMSRMPGFCVEYISQPGCDGPAKRWDGGLELWRRRFSSVVCCRDAQLHVSAG